MSADGGADAELRRYPDLRDRALSRSDIPRRPVLRRDNHLRSQQHVQSVCGNLPWGGDLSAGRVVRWRDLQRPEYVSRVCHLPRNCDMRAGAHMRAESYMSKRGNLRPRQRNLLRHADLRPARSYLRGLADVYGRNHL